MSAKNEKKKRKLYTVSNAHLDTQWNWNIQATIRDCVKNTLEQNFDLIEKYPGYRFNFEGAFRYKLAKEYYPDLYEKLKEYVADGSWNVAGSSWDACDVNVPSSEALMRQILLGNGYFEKEFGKKSTDIFLTDCFGFTYALPSIETHMGLNGFSTQKLGWGLGTPVLKDGEVLKPFKGEGDEKRMDIGKWKGPDGNSIFVALDPGGYGHNFDGNGLEDIPVNMRENYDKQLKDNEESVGVGKKMIYYGTGDYGGSPKEISAKLISEAVKNTEGEKYQVVSSTTDQIFNEFTPEEEAKLPVYDGELLIPHGYGAFTSRTVNKRWNRKNELLADYAEKAACLALLLTNADYPSEKLDFAWKNFLWHQFHDDLPGTSVPDAYQFTHNDYIISLNIFAAELKNAVGAVAKALKTNVKGTPIVVFNPTSKQVNGLVEADLPSEFSQARVFDKNGAEIACQISGKKVKFIAEVPSVGFAVYEVREGRSTIKSTLSVTKNSLENEKYIVNIDKNGDICSIFDKEIKKELLSKPSQFLVFPDTSRSWPSWEIPYEDFIVEPKAVSENVSVEIVDKGAAKVALKITRHFNKSRFEQIISLCKGGERVDVECNVEWRELASMLKLSLPASATNEIAEFDIGVGAIKRGNSDKAPYYEYTNQQWADITDKSGEYGVSLINDCKYGIDKPNDNTLRLTLIHTPQWGAWSGQCYQDIGTNLFRYSIFGHNGSREKTSDTAAAMNQPLVPFITAKHDGKSAEASILSKNDDNFIVKAVKKEEKGDRIIVRVQEMSGNGVNDARLDFGFEIENATETNGYETEIKAADYSEKTLNFTLKPFEVKTFALTLKKTGCTCGNAKSTQINLPYDKRITSTNAKATVGDFFRGISIPEEMYSETVFSGGINFNLGKKGKNNGMICAGQKIDIPENAKKLYILAAANGDKEVEFLLDNKAVKVKIQDFTEHVGQWDAISAGTNAKIKRDEIAEVYTHTHAEEGDRLYLFAYLFKYEFDVENISQFVFPKDKDIVVAAATVTTDDNSETTAAALLYDSSDGEAVKLTVKTSEGVKETEVAKGKTVVLKTDVKTADGKVFKEWKAENADIIFADSSKVLVAIDKGDAVLTAETIEFGEDICENKPCRTNVMYEGFEKPENALDGTGRRRWSSKLAEDGTATLEIFNRGGTKISRWLVEHCGAREGFPLNTKDYRLEYRNSRDGEWLIADEVKDNKNSLTVREFTPVMARQIRLVITEPTNETQSKVARIHRFCVS